MPHYTLLTNAGNIFLLSRIYESCGSGSSVGIATGYGWTVRGSNPGGGEIFHTCPDRPWGPPSLLYNGYRVFPGGKERPGRDADPSPSSNAVGHERVELYLYSPDGPYGLYRASVPVQGCTLPSYDSFCIHVTVKETARKFGWHSTGYELRADKAKPFHIKLRLIIPVQWGRNMIGNVKENRRRLLTL